METIRLKSHLDGVINLEDDAIYLNDKSSRMNKWIFKIHPFLFLIAGIYQIYSGVIAVRELQVILRIISGILFISLPLMTYHSNFIRTNKKKIELSEVANVKMKKLFGEILIDFKLKDNSTRRIYNIKNANDWGLIKNYLTERKIVCLN